MSTSDELQIFFSEPKNSTNQASTVIPKLGDYMDFRLYLRDMYEFKKQTEGSPIRPYSYSAFSAAADIKSPNYLKLIIEGKRNLSDDMVARFAKALRLDKEDTAEFRALVFYGQALDPMERNHFLKNLSDLRSRRELARGEIDSKSWDKVPSWMGWVLYSMVDQAGVSFDPELLAKLIRAKVDISDLKSSLKKLVDSGQLVKDPESDEYTKQKSASEIGQDLPVSLIRKLQAELIYLGIESLFRDSPKEREFGALTVAMTPEEFEQVRFELRQLRKRLHRDITVNRMSTKGERVYQLNIQLFPLTDKVIEN